jgi:hypothetical protein
MDLVFRALVVAIVVAGLLHTMETYYREKVRQRRSRQALNRLKPEVWKDPDRKSE